MTLVHLPPLRLHMPGLISKMLFGPIHCSFPSCSTDPDAPKYRERLHWIVTNIPAGQDATQGSEVRSFGGRSLLDSLPCQHKGS